MMNRPLRLCLRRAALFTLLTAAAPAMACAAGKPTRAAPPASAPGAMPVAGAAAAPAAAAPAATSTATAATGATAAPAAASVTAPSAIAPTELQARNAATFDVVWATVRDTHWDPTLGGVDWLAVRTELMPAAQAATTDAQLRAVLMQAMGRLGQSHFAIIPGDLSRDSEEETPPPAAAPTDAAAKTDTAAAATPAAPAAERADAAAPAPRQRRRRSGAGTVGATLSVLPSPTDAQKLEAVITAVEAGSAAENAGLRPGMIVLSIDGEDPTDRLPTGDGLERYERAAIVRAAAQGAPGSSTTWSVRTGEEAATEYTLRFETDARPVAKFGSLPAMPTELNWRHLDETERDRWGAGRREIGLIRFNIWLIPVARPFDVAMDSLRSADGIIIDLRGNPGGIGGMAMGIAGHFTAQSQSLGAMRTRDATLNFVSNPRRVSTDRVAVEPYAGPMAILVDDATASTSEIFAGGMQYLGRAKVFGSRTAGAALPAVMTPLPNGDVLLHAVADYRLPNGSALEASGVKPDNARAYTAQDYLQLGDPAMAEAVRWIATQAPAAQPVSPSTDHPSGNTTHP